MPSFFVRRHSRSCGFVARVSFYCLQRGSGRLIKSNVAPKLCDMWHIFFGPPGTEGSKNNCDFAGFDLNGDWIFQSSHAPVKTAIIILLSFRFPTCITSQVKLCGNLGNYSVFIFKEPLASSASYATFLSDRVSPVRTMLGSAEKGAQTIAVLQKFADLTPFKNDEVRNRFIKGSFLCVKNILQKKKL